MSEKISTSIHAAFGEMPDFRVNRTKEHELIDILFITLCAVISGLDDSWEEIEMFGKARQDWLKNYINLKNGVPSHDTFRRVFIHLDAKVFESCFIDWVSSLGKKVEGATIAIDGKTLRGSRCSAKNHPSIHMVSAWCCDNQMVIGQAKVDEKTNEITAIPELIDLLELKGATVTVDAMGTQKKIAQKIISKESDYVMGLKGNQGQIHQEVKEWFNIAHQHGFGHVKVDCFEQTDAGHGRVEQRVCRAISSDYIETLKGWPGIHSVIEVISTRHTHDKEQTEARYYLSSKKPEAEELLKHIRSHWQIENTLHWCLDVTFKEDLRHHYVGHSAHNLATVRHVALNLLKQETSLKKSIKLKRSKALLSNDYLDKVIAMK